MQVKIDFDKKALSSKNKKIARAARNATRDAINQRVTQAVRRGNKVVAAKLQLPLKYVNNRYTLNRSIKARRAIVSKASTKKLSSHIDVYVQGIPFSTLATSANERAGMRARRQGRPEANKVRLRKKHYKGAFWAPNRQGKPFVYYEKPGGGMYAPKFGVRKAMRREYDRRLLSPQGIAALRAKWQVKMRQQLRKIT